MEKKSTSKKVDKSQEIASCRKSISETTVLLKEKIQLLTVLFNKLTISERNLIGEELMEVFSKTTRMIWNLSRNLEEVTLEKPAARFLFPEVR